MSFVCVRACVSVSMSECKCVQVCVSVSSGVGSSSATIGSGD